MSVPTTDIDIDISARSFWAKPFEERERTFAWLRANRPVSFHRPYESELMAPGEDTPGFWSLSKFDDIRAVSRDPKLFCSSQGIVMEDFPEVVQIASQSFLAMDAPRHRELRGIVSKAFTPARTRLLEGVIRANVTQLVDDMIGTSGGDFCELFAKHLPARIFADFFGITDGEQRATVIDAAEKMLAWDDPDASAGRDALTTYADEADRLADVAYALAEEREDHPGEDLMTWLVQAEFEGHRMETWEVASFFVLLSAAANDTTRHSVAHAVRLLTENPDQRALLLSDIDAHLDGAAEEIIRHSSPVMQFRRTATADTEIRGVPIAKGDKVVMWYCSGNRDEEVFADPGAFDITRDLTNHLGFGGGGAHYCLGAALGRTMVKEAIREIYTRTPDIESGEPHFMVGNFLHGVHRLPVHWRP